MSQKEQCTSIKAKDNETSDSIESSADSVIKWWAYLSIYEKSIQTRKLMTNEM